MGEIKIEETKRREGQEEGLMINSYRKNASLKKLKKNKTFDGIESSEGHLLYPFDEAHLRQLRSKFDRLSTYLFIQIR